MMPKVEMVGIGLMAVHKNAANVVQLVTVVLSGRGLRWWHGIGT